MLRKEVLEQVPVLVFGERSFPPFTRDEHVELQLTLPLTALHGRLLGRDDLTARVTLLDADTGRSCGTANTSRSISPPEGRLDQRRGRERATDLGPALLARGSPGW